MQRLSTHKQRLKPYQLLHEDVPADEPPAEKAPSNVCKAAERRRAEASADGSAGRWLRDWMLCVRRCEQHFAVAETHIQPTARAQFGIAAGDKWV